MKNSSDRKVARPLAKRNRVRIVGGVWRSRLLEFPDVPDLRPTGDRVRETLFNWLGQSLQGKHCLDLFAGSGGLGFEALSRHAAHVTMVESHRATHLALHASKDRLNARELTLVHGDARQYLRACKQVFDIVFLDPPFKAALIHEVLDLVPRVMAQDAIMYLESSVDLHELAPHWKILKRSHAGIVKFGLFSAPQLGDG